MPGQRINRVSGRIIVGLSLIALLTVLYGYTRRPEPDEGAAAHIFQLSVAALLPMLLVFLGTADWKRPLRSVRPLALPMAFLVFAFVALHLLEHPN
jgi:hypothetical protein